ncbi:hypothetical protein ACZ91_56360, partial [Streptomyces regensis]
MPFLVPIVAEGVASGVARHQANHQGTPESQLGGISAPQIYEAIMSGAGTESLVNGQQASTVLRQRYNQRIEQIAALDAKMNNAWTGEGSASARMGANPLKVWMDDASTNLGKSDAVLQGQTSAFEKVKSAVQPLPAEAPQSDFWNDIQFWGTDLDKKIAEYNAKAQANVNAFNAY